VTGRHAKPGRHAEPRRRGGRRLIRDARTRGARNRRRRRSLVSGSVRAATGMVLVTAAAAALGIQLRPQEPPAEPNAGTASREAPEAETKAPPVGPLVPSSPPAPDRSREAQDRQRPQAAIVVPEAGPGTFRVAADAPRTAPGVQATSYTVEVEDGLPFAVDGVAEVVDATLSDPRGWSATGRHQLRRVNTEASLRVVLASPATADGLCSPLETQGRLSCRNGHMVVLNAWRWANGANGYERRLPDYRRYVVNHEIGHALGYPHVTCPGVELPAPVMLQQTIGLDGCLPNPWPAAVDQI
jgi:hypothetical protein